MTAAITAFQKNWGAHIRNLIIGLILAWLTFQWTAKEAAQNELVKKVDSKLDASDFAIHERSNSRSFENLERENKTATSETNQLLRQLLEIQAKQSTDLEWLKKRSK
jgi:regulatory protein YycI of two-component signal transduction system YycFG